MARTAGCPTLHDDEHDDHHHIQHPTPTTAAASSSTEDILYQPTPQIQVKPTSLNNDGQQRNDIPSQFDVTKRRGSQSVPPPALKSSSCLSPPSVPRRPHSVRFSPEPPEVFHYPAAPHEKTPKAKLFLPWEEGG
ncbi:predicted protein [Lichtheimia corymbifera JMRC:FSU:9682]|uniref:Uncharacterized protein n=1 Tax=Lichtheimia corymbifera JMRC:FSU:9682 TaxID=1263082 RepID=A0A068SBL8_9FUNG|nr:predicted protein [Lichtheimia corymbifera JMRC:FSU:9682]